MEPIEAALLLTIWYVFPILYVSLSKKGGQWFPIKNSSCPFGPRAGWLIIIIFLGAIGLILFRYHMSVCELSMEFQLSVHYRS